MLCARRFANVDDGHTEHVLNVVYVAYATTSFT